MVWLYVLIGILGAILLFAALYFGGTGYVIHSLMQPKKRTDEFLIEHETRDKRFDRAWLEIPFEEKFLLSDLGNKLRARLYWNEKGGNKFILLLHGHNSSGIGMMKYLPIFLDLGYHVLIPDHRFSGASEGKSITFGCYEKRDAKKWIDLLEAEHPGATFAVFGESMGAATATLLAGMDARIRFLIEYCGYAGFEQLVLPYLKSNALVAFVRPGMQAMAKLLYHVDFKEIDALSAMRTLKIPVLILHSRADKVVYFNNAEAFLSANPAAKTHFFEDSAHARSWVLHPEEFTAAVRDFVLAIDSENP